MPKTGILTYHFTINFGATLQAYALYQIIKEHGYEVEFIDYRPKWIRVIDSRYLYWGFLGQPYLPSPYLINGAIKAWKMRQFLISNMNLSSKKYYTKEELKNCENEYDVVICGSDEIWNINREFDTSYFLDFISNPKTRKISYAASFGSTTSLGDQKNSVCNLLKDFYAISVRDTNSVKLVNECSREATKVLDPTFLGDFTKIIKYPEIKNEYILVYGGLTKEEGKYIRSVADVEGLDIISVGARPGRGNPHINLIGIGPDEWLGYFARASYIFTSFYHGVIFSIIFKRPFTYFSRSNKAVKVEDLLKDIGLENRKIASEKVSQLKPKLLKEISWENLNLEKMIQQSKRYLLNSLEN